METTPKLELPYLAAAQAQKHVTHNEALRKLDALIQISVLGHGVQTPPAAPQEADSYLVGDGAEGDWLDKPNQIAVWQDHHWVFYPPLQGWLVWNSAAGQFLVFDGTQWTVLAGSGQNGAVNPAPLVGVNTLADVQNRLAVKSPAVLFSYDDGSTSSDIRIKANKAGQNDTASLVFQDGFSGRAEIGLTGDDDFHFKVSDDGAVWKEAITLDKNSGEASFPNTNIFTNFSANLLQDSGRFHNAIGSINASAFVMPSYLKVYNGSVLSNYAKYITNSASWTGGTAAALDPDVKDLYIKIRSSSTRRWGPEFYVLNLKQGNGTGGSVTIDGTVYYSSLYTRQQPRFAASTFHIYLRAKVGNTVVRVFPGQTVYIDGVKQASHYSLTPADGWKSVRITDRADPYTSFGYSPAHFNLQHANNHDEVLLACPALVPGLSDIDINIGVMAGYNIW